MAQTRPRFIGWIVAIAAIAAPAYAQDEPRFALVASLPTPTVAFQWEMSERFALRIDGGYSFRDESTDIVSGQSSFSDRTTGRSVLIETTTHTESTIHTGFIGVAGIITIHRSDELRLYAAPRVSLSFARQRATSTTTTPALPPGLTFIFTSPGGPETETFESSSTSPSAGASFGAEATVHRRLAVFGEVGFTVGWSDSSLPTVIGGLSPISRGESSRTTVNTRAVVGVMLRF